MLRTKQYFDSADGTRTQIIGLKYFGPELVSVSCMVSRDRELIDAVTYTQAGYLAARERAQEAVS